VKGLNEMQLEVLKQEPITNQAIKETGLAFDEMMAVQLTVPDEDVFIRGGWCVGWNGKHHPFKIAKSPRAMHGGMRFGLLIELG